MDQFPDYHFTQSQPQLYQFIKEDHPDLFEAISRRIEEKRWEPIGGMWVEADCNLSGAESLARQFLLGRTFFREHFGTEAESPVLWLPDVFGYAWALPQLIRQAGIKYFMTIKIGWSQYNRLPYDTFLWQGIDGTQVLTHFSTVKEFGSPYASTYNSMANPKESLGTWQGFQQKELHKDLLMAYGYGDGLMMPEMDGWEICKEVRSFSDVPIIVLSALNDPSMVASVLDASADDYLTKPTPSRILVAHINPLMRSNGTVPLSAPAGNVLTRPARPLTAA